MDWDKVRELPRMAPAPTFHERVVWRLIKDTRWAEARIRQVPHGYEVRFVVGGDGREETLMHSNVFREGHALAAYATGIRQTFEVKGWVLMPETPSA